MKRTTLIRSLLPLALAGAMGGGTSLARAAESNPQEEAAITKMAEAFVEAFQKGDAKAVAAFWTTHTPFYRPRSSRQILELQPRRA